MGVEEGLEGEGWRGEKVAREEDEVRLQQAQMDERASADTQGEQIWS